LDAWAETSTARNDRRARVKNRMMRDCAKNWQD
jgi:hypothetical protein